MRILLLPQAERDLEIGADFYESQRLGLGVYFNDCLASDIEALRIYAGIMKPIADFIVRCRNVFRFRFITS